VRVSAAADGESVKFSVEDTGAGIPKEYQDRIFERFFRVPGQSSASGAGLGLAICKDIVEAHGGRISVETREGKGSKFTFALQRAPESAERLDAEPEHASRNGQEIQV